MMSANGTVAIRKVGDNQLTINCVLVDGEEAAKLMALQVGRKAPVWVEHIGKALDVFVEYLQPRLMGESSVSRHGPVISVTVDLEEDTLEGVEAWLRFVIADQAHVPVRGGSYRDGSRSKQAVAEVAADIATRTRGCGPHVQIQQGGAGG